ncbi:hypothetical protein, partial [Vibrio neptunius]|uniref:hypothetical protein n=1 Tax=Vibrio neptunius TaxID=170651 RepID=UPI0030D88C0B
DARASAFLIDLKCFALDDGAGYALWNALLRESEKQTVDSLGLWNNAKLVIQLSSYPVIQLSSYPVIQLSVGRSPFPYPVSRIPYPASLTKRLLWLLCAFKSHLAPSFKSNNGDCVR